MTEKYDVCAIGNAIVDVISTAEDVFLEREKIAKGAMMLIDADRAESLYAKMGTAVESSGGSAGNTAAGLASLGSAASFIGKVRDDQLGAIFSHDMRAIGVHFSTPPAQEGPATARSLIFVTPDAQRSMNTYLGACVEFGVIDLQPDLIRASDITYLEGYLFDKRPAQEAFREAARLARSAGKKMALTLSDTFCVDRHRDAFLALVKEGTDILFANENELKSLYQVSSFEEGLAAARTQCAMVVGTRSEKGAVIAAGDETAEVAAASCPKVVDTTGAGDLFAAGFLHGLGRKLPLAVCGRIGAIAAAEVIGHVGPRPQTNLKRLVEQKLAESA
ncbi:MAG: adenosine kinase [Alphaproteobacteria bacterium]|nr:adenosine kinase [Alphaproteobacteria bacterium]